MHRRLLEERSQRGLAGCLGEVPPKKWEGSIWVGNAPPHPLHPPMQAWLASHTKGLAGVVLHSPLLSGMRVLSPGLKWWPAFADV